MSQITENTIVVKNCDAAALERVIAKYSDKYRIGDSFKMAYANNDISVYVFDCNGDPCFIQCDGQIYPEIQETCYGREIWTMVKQNGNMQTKRNHCKYYLKKMIPSNDFEEVAKRIGYTINK